VISATQKGRKRRFFRGGPGKAAYGKTTAPERRLPFSRSPFSMKTGYLIDMDGVIYRENTLISGAAEFIQSLTVTGTPFLFLTNNSAPTPEDLAVRLKHLGVHGLTAKHFYTSALNTADFLSETDPNCTVFVIGEGGILTALHERKIANDGISPSYVVVGEGATTMEKLSKAHEHIERGARLLATNPDNWCPVSSQKTRPGAGATASFLEASTGRRAYYLGKPNGYMFHRARRKLAELALHEITEVAMIGDTMETDIRGAFEAGLHSFLVLSGSTPLESVGDYVYQPTRILNSVADLVDEIRTGKPSDRRDSPAFVDQSFYSEKRGIRHQTDILALHKPRPRPAMTR
jgi:NagD protein